MRRDAPAERISAVAALEQFNKTVGRKLKWYRYAPSRRWRLRPKKENLLRMLWEDGGCLVRELSLLAAYIIGFPYFLGLGVIRGLRHLYKKRKTRKGAKPDAV